MAVNYNKLWKRLIDEKMNRTQLRTAAHISTNAVAKLGKNEPVSFETLEKICRALKCDIGDIMEIEFPDVSEGEKEE
jgi:DNA (cytosine-5)-methyltransferase 1